MAIKDFRTFSPVTDVAGPVLMLGAPGPTPDAVDVLVALRGVFGKVNARAEHAAYVGVPLIEALLHDGVDEGGTVEEHALVALVVVLLRNLV